MLHLKVITREGILLDEDIKSLSSVNDDGKFDVLDQHAQFISIIKEKLTIRNTEGKTKEIKVDSGVMRVKDNLVQVFLGLK